MRATRRLEPLRSWVSSWPRTTLAFVAAAPALAAILLSAVILLVLAVGGTSRWLDNDFNPAEAALVGDVGRLYRLLEMGQPIGRAYPLRKSNPFKERSRLYGELTPLDAAIVGDRVGTLVLLLERGAAGTPPDLNAIWCLARTKEAHDIDRWLTKKAGGPANATTCP